MRRINKKGFTLIEIITVIVILGILMTIATIGVSKYIQNARNNTYNSYIKNIETAAENKMVECVTGQSNCDIPESGYKEIVSIESLIDEGYSDKLKDPEEDGSFCTGYVEVENKGASVPDLKYKGCLKCSKYETDGCNFEEDNDDDNKILACDELNAVGTSTEWTRNSRTIKFGCNSEGKECKYQKTFTATATNPVIKEGEIEIAEGNVCKVNVYIDTTKPTCELIVSDAELGEDGWYLENVNVKLKYGSNSEREITDFDFGISTSTKKEYNKKSILTATTGITTVFGYVKDDLGNEGYCSTEIKVDSTKPAQELMVGYQIYPEEKNTSTTGTNEFVIEDLEKYKSVKGVLVFLKDEIDTSVSLSTNIQTATIGLGETSNVVNNNEEVMSIDVNGSDLVEFIFPKTSTLGTIDITGIDPNNIDKIMMLVGNTDGLYTNKDMIVYNFAGDNGTGVASSKGYSFDGGTTWQNNKYKIYESNTTVTTVVRDTLGTKSEAKTIEVNRIDKESPSCSVSGNPTSWTNHNVTLQVNGSDSGVSGLDTIKKNSSSEIDYTGSYKQVVGYNGTFSYVVKDKAGNTGECSAVVSKIDKYKPTVTVTVNNASVATKSKTATISINDSLSKLPEQTVYYGWGTNETTAEYKTATISADSSSYSISTTSPSKLTGTYYLFVKAGIKDNAGNATDASKSVAMTLDNNPPVCPTFETISGEDYETWTNKNLLLYVEPSNDTVSWRWGVSTDGGAYVDLDEDFVGSKQFVAFSTDGKKRGRVVVTDSAGNTQTCMTDEYWLDKSNPAKPTFTMTHTYKSSEADGSKAIVYTSNTWINKTVYMTDARYSTFKGPSSTDIGGSGIKEIQISSDNKTWYTYSYDYTNSLYAMSSTGTYNRYVRAVDNAGNVSDVASATIKIDKVAPNKPTLTMTHSHNSSKAEGNKATIYSNNTWIKNNVYMTDARYSTFRGPSSSDSNSGIKEIQISSDNNTWETYSYDSSRELYRLQTEGTHYRYFRAIDNAGNVSSVETKTIKLDKTAPTVPTVNLYKWKDNNTAPPSSDGLSKYTTGTTSDKKIYTTASGSTDSGAGGIYYQYTTTGATTNQTNVKKSYRSIEADGTSYIKYRACDSLGNCSAYTSNYKVVIDKTTVSIGGNAGKWQVVYRKRTSCDYWAAKIEGDCPGVYGNIIAKVDMSYVGNQVTFNYQIAQGSETWIADSYWVKLHIVKSDGTKTTYNLKEATGSAWTKGSVHSGSKTATLDKGTYTIKLEGNSVSPSYTANVGTVTIK